MFDAGILYNATHAIGVEGIFELPERVTGQIITREELATPWQAERLPAVPQSSQGTCCWHEERDRMLHSRKCSDEECPISNDYRDEKRAPA